MLETAIPLNGRVVGAPLLSTVAASCDAETKLVAALRTSGGETAPVPKRKSKASGRSASARLRRQAAEIVKQVEARLPGCIRELRVEPRRDEWVLAGVSNSFYVKQVAQHVAMGLLGGERLVNCIEVRTVR
jgi:hypothetical protein